MDRRANSIVLGSRRYAKPAVCNESGAIPMVESLALDELVDGKA